MTVSAAHLGACKAFTRGSLHSFFNVPVNSPGRVISCKRRGRGIGKVITYRPPKFAILVLCYLTPRLLSNLGFSVCCFSFSLSYLPKFFTLNSNTNIILHSAIFPTRGCPNVRPRLTRNDGRERVLWRDVSKIYTIM